MLGVRAGRLDRGRILDAAEAIVARGGTAKLTMRAIGSELGADPTAVYRHFRSKEELLAQLGERLLGGRVEVPPGTSWRETMRLELRRRLERFRAQTDLALLLTGQAVTSSSVLDATEHVLDRLAELGLGPADQAWAYQLLENHLVGTAMLYAVLERGPRARKGRHEAIRSSLAALSADRHPRIVAAAPHLFTSDLDQVFGDATEALLEIIERRAVSPPA